MSMWEKRRDRSLRGFIRGHRPEIDAHIRMLLNRPERQLNDTERADFINNDWTLYTMAKEWGWRG